jgi:SAM-dependent methyltransferase
VTVTPRAGHFYPRGLLDMPDTFLADRRPFRLLAIDDDGIEIDLNHPLAQAALTVTATVEAVDTMADDVGGRLSHWGETIAKDGPGMAARAAADRPTPFAYPGGFARRDEGDDAGYYAQPRLVPHIDRRADAILTGLHARLLAGGGDVLDLMSSWESHLPDGTALRSLTGLGLNADELARNPRLTARVHHDVNAAPALPFADNSFDGVLCALSVDYLTDPAAVFADVARVLRPGGLFVVSFSNRWFPPKVVALWEELHDYERPAYVLETLAATGRFQSLETFSMRGDPRPTDDPHFPGQMNADPIFAVWGRAR